MGYNAGGTYFENHRSSGFDTVGSDISCVTTLRRSKRQAPVDMNSNTVFTENDIDPALVESTTVCRRHYQQDVANIRNNTFEANLVLPCPRQLGQAGNDPRFILDAQFRNAAGTTCYIQRMPAAGVSETGPITYGQQCCYNDSDVG